MYKRQGLVIAVFESGILLAALLFCFVWEDISVVKTIVLLLYSFMVYASLNQAGSMLSMIGILDTGLSQVEALEKTEQLVCEKPAQKADSDEIVFDRVSFSYGSHEVLHKMCIRDRSCMKDVQLFLHTGWKALYEQLHTV